MSEEQVEVLDTSDIKIESKKEKKKKDKKDELIEKLTLEVNTLNDKVLRLTAEIQNIRKRNDEQISNLMKYDGEELIKQLLNVVDNFERAISLDDTNLEDELSKFLSGFKMIYANMNNILTNQGVTELEALNKVFDPNTMEAVLTEKIEGIEPNMVVDVLQKGYLYHGKVIRHAMVKVSE